MHLLFAAGLLQIRDAPVRKSTDKVKEALHQIRDDVISCSTSKALHQIRLIRIKTSLVKEVYTVNALSLTLDDILL